MAHEFRLQDPGEGIHEAEILEITVSKGDHVSEGDTVVVAETDKAAVEIPAPVDGEVREIRVAVGDIAEVGDVLMVFGEAGDDTEQDADRSGAAEQDSDTDTDEKKSAEDARKDDENGETSDEAPSGESDGADTGHDDTDTQDNEVTEDGSTQKSGDTTSSAAKKPLATPAVRGLARELVINLANVKGSGKDGRVLKKDVQDAAGDKGDAGRAEGAKIVELRSLRRTTARRMAQAWREIPHVTHQDVIEITALERLRREHEAEIEQQGGALTLTPFIVKALAITLADFPNFNATFDADACAVHQLPDVNIGVALDTDRGLLVPVLRDAGAKSIAELAVNLKKLGDRLREDAATRDDLRGATFTLTNVGAIGGTGLAPIINPPQTAIFGVARAELRHVVRGDIDEHTTEVALCLPVCLTFDHRVADGAEAARFVQRVKALLDDPGALVLNS
ncbi:dihydrolipoamide acetyltransferase family protein [uncultured Sulfitobacter sp.]|uniref:dihydrolipoamide acetyltransferase family protein n=1 Tax=uncultured Sulfitobacter sp. TaxID=191468 RepID=UPI002634425A|nr:dihydrolipoamide acetyltransferase family protein [uncultured Sulfitobacter sp.]